MLCVKGIRGSHLRAARKKHYGVGRACRNPKYVLFKNLRFFPTLNLTQNQNKNTTNPKIVDPVAYKLQPRAPREDGREAARASRRGHARS